MNMTISTAQVSLPTELVREIIQILSLADQKNFSLTSQLNRDYSIPFIFGHLRFAYRIIPKICSVHQARKDIKDVVKKLELLHPNWKEDEDFALIFRFLESLPNLRVFHYRGFCIPPGDIPWLISSVRHAPLRELLIDTECHAFASHGGPPTPSLVGLEKLSIIWWLGDDYTQQPGTLLAHLQQLVLPSLPTLVELRIDNECEDHEIDLDLQIQKPASDTLRSFQCILKSRNESILDTIPEIFPHLTRLSIEWKNLLIGHSILWKDAHIRSLCKNAKLTDLTLSFDFEENDNDPVRSSDDPAWYVRCYTRRLKTTQDLASACSHLERCSWIVMGTSPSNGSMIHPFIVEKRLVGGNETRVVRGLKQTWMGRNRPDCWGRGIVKCKLEDLPGEIIGGNDTDVDDADFESEISGQ